MKRRKMRNKFSKRLSVLPTTKPKDQVKYDRVVNKQYLDKTDIKKEDRLGILISAAGTGKTTAALEAVENDVACYVAVTTELAGQVSKKAGAYLYSNGLSGFRKGDHKLLCVTTKGLPRFVDTLIEKGVKYVIIDDASYSLSETNRALFVPSDFCSKEESAGFLLALTKLYDSGANFIFLDTDIRPHIVKYIEAILGKR